MGTTVLDMDGNYYTNTDTTRQRWELLDIDGNY